MAKDFGFDAPRVTHDEAVELCVYHLQMASAYFQVVPDDGNSQLREEIRRKMGTDDYALGPAISWSESIFNRYEARKKEEE